MSTSARRQERTEPRGTLTEGLVELIRNRPVGQEDLEATALLVLDGVANMLAGRRTEPGRKLLAFLERHPGDAGRRALAMGGLMHILEVDDLHKASVLHPACVTVPAALALAPGTGAGGRGFLEAVLFGYEACSRVGMSVGGGHYKIWHNTGTCGTFGGTMTAAQMLGLSDGETVHALGNAGTQSAGLWEFLDTGAMSKHLHAGRAAEAGVVSAELAALGFTGPPAILEGPRGLYAGTCPDPDPAAVLRDADGPWQVHRTSIKPWPSCRHTHPAVDAALELAGRVDMSAAERIEVSTYQAAIDVCDRPSPDSEYEAKFSLQHCVAVSLLDGTCEFASFGPEARARAGELRAMTRVRAGESYSEAYPRDWGGEVTVRLAGGGAVTAARTSCKGDPEAALSPDEMVAKARSLLDFAGFGDAGRLVDDVLAMASGGTVPEIAL